MTAVPASARWLSVIGVGEDGLAGLAPVARALVDQAEVLIGGDRHLAMVPDNGRERHAWPTPLSALADRIAAFRGRRVAVLATGDPLAFGIGATLVRHVDADEMTIIPALSAFSLAAARLCWPMDEVATITLHGRPAETLALHVHPCARLLILAHDRTTPATVGEWLASRGFGASPMIALAHMGGDRETRTEGTAEAWSATVPDFHTLAVTCRAGPGARWLPRTAGLPDEAFRHDGNITKRELRALALARLMPHPGARLWDIGAGCGSVAIEWLRAAPNGRAIAVERRADRRTLIADNALALGVPHLDLRDLAAPDGLGGLPAPDAVFIGGGLCDATIAAAVAALGAGGRLVAHAVTLESEGELVAAHRAHGGDLARVAVSRAVPVGAFRGFRPAMPVTQWAMVK